PRAIPIVLSSAVMAHCSEVFDEIRWHNHEHVVGAMFYFIVSSAMGALARTESHRQRLPAERVVLKKGKPLNIIGQNIARFSQNMLETRIATQTPERKKDSTHPARTHIVAMAIECPAIFDFVMHRR
ncbi:MAG: hypothetical protein ACR2PG_08395, partial [Hyphomicrobiaceae bacterium]